MHLPPSFSYQYLQDSIPNIGHCSDVHDSHIVMDDFNLELSHTLIFAFMDSHK